MCSIGFRCDLLKKIGILSILFPSMALAGLTWESEYLQLEREAADKSVEGVFKFKNTGKQPVTIKEVESACSCTVPTLEKRVYAPGESGEIRAVFTFGGRTGLQRKLVAVKSDDPDQNTTKLILEVMINDRLKLSPKTLLWRGGEPLAPKVATVTAKKKHRINTIRAVSTLKGLQIDVKTVEAGEKYEVVVTPRVPAPFRGEIRVETEIGTENSAVYFLKVAADEP